MFRIRHALSAAVATLGVAGAIGVAQPADARTFVSVGVGLPVVAPAPVYAAPVPYPAYAAPVGYPVYGYGPAPAYYGPSVYFGHAWWGWHGGWRGGWHR